MFVGENGSSNDNQKIRKDCHWSLPLEGWYKANFVGMAKGNPGAMGSGGVTRNCHGYGIAAVTFPLRHQTNHYTEDCAALQTTKLVKEVRVKSLWLEGDSNNTINYLRGEHSPS